MPRLSPVQEELFHSDAKFRTLYEEHLEYKQKLDSMRSKSLPSEEDEIEMKRIKLHKLTLKDKMEALMLSHLRGEASA